MPKVAAVLRLQVEKGEPCENVFEQRFMEGVETYCPLADAATEDMMLPCPGALMDGCPLKQEEK